MMWGKKLISCTMAIVVVMTMLLAVPGLEMEAAGTEVTYAVTGGNITFDTSTGTITDCDESVTEVVIPNTIEGVFVTGIGYGAFAYCYNLRSVKIPASVATIGDNAFSSCTNLESIEIPTNVTSIGYDAFFSCGSLKSVEIPASVTTIKGGAFSNCYSLNSVEIPASVTSIEDYVFSSCGSLKNVKIPISVTTIGDNAFSYCTNLESIEIPTSVTSMGNSTFADCYSLSSIEISANVTSIGDNAFSSCNSLESINIDKNNRVYSSINGVFFNKDQTILICYPMGKAQVTYEIPASVTSIEDDAFEHCQNLKNIKIPTSVMTIGDGAFSDCSNLSNIEIPENVTSIGTSAFAFCYSLDNINVNANNTTYSSVDGVCFDKDQTTLVCYPVGKTQTTYEIPTNVTDIGYLAFWDCYSLSSIKIPASVINIGQQAFSYCGNLSSIEIPVSVKSIGDNVFYYCDNLTDIYYGGSEEDWNNIDIGEFNDKLMSVTIHYNSTGSGDTEHAGPSVKVTEDMLFSTEYCRYLSNNTYNSMINTLKNDMTDVGSDSQWSDFCIALKTCFSGGIVGQLELIKDSILGAFTGKDITEERVQEELMLAYVNNVNSHSEYIKDLYEAGNSSLSESKEMMSILQKGVSQGGDILQSVASNKDIEELAKGLDAIFGYGDELKVEQDLKKLLKSSEVMKKSSEILKASGKAISAYQVAMSIEMLKLTSEDTLLRYMSLVDKDSEVYTGLKINYNKIKKQDITVFAMEMLEQDGISEILGYMVEHITGKGTGAATVVAVVEFAYGIADLWMSHMGVLDVEDWLKAQSSLRNQMQLYSAWSVHYTNIFDNYLGKESHNIKDLKNNYQDIFELYLSCILTTPDYLDGFSNQESYYTELNKDLNKYKSKLTYEKYIQSCLKNANASYTYTVTNGQATITGVDFDSEPSKKLANALKLSTKSDENTLDFCLDVPNEVNGYPVVAIGEGVFQNNQEITMVSIPASIETIGTNAFNGCGNIQEVFLENGLKTIGGNAFSECTQLTSIDIPDTVTEINDNAFSQNTEIQSHTGSEAESYASANGNTFNNRKKDVREISVKQKPDKMTYTMTEELDLSGLVLNVTYGDGSTEEIDSGYSGFFVERKKGTSQVTIFYEGAVTTFDIEITSGECEYIIQYINESGEVIHEPFRGTAEIGAEVVLEVPEIKGYICDETNIKKTIKGNNLFTVTYTAAPKKDIAEASVDYDNSFVVTGSNIEPEVQVSFNKRLLQKGVDYTVEYSNNLKVGTGNIWITGIGEYDGVLLYNFEIKNKQDTIPDRGKNPDAGGNGTLGSDSIQIPSENKSNNPVNSVRRIFLSALSNKIAAGKRIKLTANIFPVNASDQRLIWSSSNPKVATVNQSGIVTMKKKTGGKSVIITARAADGSGATAAFRIKSMKGVVKKVTIAGAKKRTVKAGQKLKLKAKVTAAKGANKKLIWTSSNTKYATVSASGKVKTKKPGKGKKVKITAMATDGSNKKMTVTIKIK